MLTKLAAWIYEVFLKVSSVKIFLIGLFISMMSFFSARNLCVSYFLFPFVLGYIVLKAARFTHIMLTITRMYIFIALSVINRFTQNISIIISWPLGTVQWSIAIRINTKLNQWCQISTQNCINIVNKTQEKALLWVKTKTCLFLQPIDMTHK